MTSVEGKAPKRPSVKAQVEAIKLKHEDLSKRTSGIKNPSELLPEVKDFIGELRALGRDVAPGANRDLLISLASYWATYYFQHSEENTYPITTLEPYLGSGEDEGSMANITGVFQKILIKPESESSWLGGAAEEVSQPPVVIGWFLKLTLVGRILAIGAPLVLIGVILAVALSHNGGTSAIASTTPTLAGLTGTQVALETIMSGMTEMVSQQPTMTAVVIASETPLPATSTVEQVQTPSSGGTAVPQDTPLASPTVGGGIENQGVSVLIQNLNDLQEVPPQMELNVFYANFTPGWSVHLLFQPLSKGLIYYPVPDYYLVGQGYNSGEWNVTVNFGTGDALNTREQYAITPVMATTDTAREALAAAESSGLEELPEGVFTAPQLITRVYTVVRRAYTVVNEVRVIYSALDEKASTMDLYAMRPDGSDPVRLTDTPEISERNASLSPDGTRIVFVGRSQPSTSEARSYSVWIMDSNGSNKMSIAQDPNLVYERPLWSPDGKYIAYSSSPSDTSVLQVRESWALYLYDIAAERNIMLDTGLNFGRQPAWSSDGRTLYFSAFNPETATLGIYSINLDSQEIKRVYDEKGNEMQPLVSPDGNQLLFLDYDTSQLYIMDIATGQVDTVAMQRFIDLGYAVWSPDGSSLFFEVNASSAYSIWTVNLSEPEPVQLTPGNTEVEPSAGLLVVYLPKQ